jgi:hypothetical protein
MLSCIYHASGEILVLEDDECEPLIARGDWFRHPLEAKKASLEAQLATLEEKEHDNGRSNGKKRIRKARAGSNEVNDGRQAENAREDEKVQRKHEQ